MRIGTFKGDLQGGGGEGEVEDGLVDFEHQGITIIAFPLRGEERRGVYSSQQQQQQMGKEREKKARLGRETERYRRHYLQRISPQGSRQAGGKCFILWNFFTDVYVYEYEKKHIHTYSTSSSPEVGPVDAMHVMYAWHDKTAVSHVSTTTTTTTMRLLLYWCDLGGGFLPARVEM
jgi:hypothetical protein